MEIGLISNFKQEFFLIIDLVILDVPMDSFDKNKSYSAI